MTGTGVQNDPYIPTTLTEFITAVGTAGAYVALTQDINAADDPEYMGELTTPITWAAASVQGGGFTLAGGHCERRLAPSASRKACPSTRCG